MTKREFELIASILADAESRIVMDTFCSKYSVEQTSYAMEILEGMVKNFSKQLKERHPRFNEGTFEVFSLPVKSETLKQRILASLETDAS